MRNVLVIMSLALLYSCANNEQEIILDGGINGFDSNSSKKIELSEAKDYANLYFSRVAKTKSGTEDLKISYYVETGVKTKSNTLPSDTLAYIINRGNDNGFVVVSTCNTVFPLLAFSDKGNFSFEKNDEDVVYKEFLSGLNDYYTQNSSSENKNYDVNSFLDNCMQNTGVLASSWDQGEPFNKYVIEEHPRCPTGCVAVATGMIMTHCKKTMTYHNEFFDNEQINNGLTKNKDSQEYINAVDRAAKLLYYIGKDVDMNYSPSGSGAVSAKVPSVLEKEGFNLPFSQLRNYNIIDIINYLLDDNIIYMRGRDYNKGAGHAWVVDGYAFCYVVPDPNDFQSTTDPLTIDESKSYLHCDWGWNGSCNGFFTGDVFNTGGYEFSGKQYFAVEVEN